MRFSGWFVGVLRGLDLVWESATPPTHIWEKSPKKTLFFFVFFGGGASLSGAGVHLNNICTKVPSDKEGGGWGGEAACGGGVGRGLCVKGWRLATGSRVRFPNLLLWSIMLVGDSDQRLACLGKVCWIIAHLSQLLKLHLSGTGATLCWVTRRGGGGACECEGDSVGILLLGRRFKQKSIKGLKASQFIKTFELKKETVTNIGLHVFSSFVSYYNYCLSVSVSINNCICTCICIWACISICMFSPHLLPVHYIIVMSLSEGGSRQKRRESSRSCSECCNRFRVQTQGWTKEENKICFKIVLCSEQGWSGGGLSCNHLIFEVLDEDGRYTRLALAQRMIWWDRLEMMGEDKACGGNRRSGTRRWIGLRSAYFQCNCICNCD